eukprot:scaffold336_cov384-Prasinococcus_capsulatus_cf.AAC.12
MATRRGSGAAAEHRLDCAVEAAPLRVAGGQEGGALPTRPAVAQRQCCGGRGRAAQRGRLRCLYKLGGSMMASV